MVYCKTEILQRKYRIVENSSTYDLLSNEAPRSIDLRAIKPDCEVYQ